MQSQLASRDLIVAVAVAVAAAAAVADMGEMDGSLGPRERKRAVVDTRPAGRLPSQCAVNRSCRTLLPQVMKHSTSDLGAKASLLR